MRLFWVALGCFFVALGVIGALLPVMPTTIFLILAAGCFARGSERLEAWLLDHPRVGPPIRQWREQGAIPRKGKIAACAGIAFGYGVFWLTARPHLPLALGVALGMAVCALWIVTRPAPVGPA
ncbi:YbaN family protein [Sphingomonas sp. NIBR02145]|uniref:YbaN family protein n=1 Tax=Sphingomonas sp. NIBR02145 TaxID=3014784 RepID=UPI0022B398DA|nr:YbaN family protein [Sphingomonas sp. NIBR02145]WHU03108.1 YbaN family protein [Sphingomonas sp. NIBR02145]